MDGTALFSFTTRAAMDVPNAARVADFQRMQ